MRIPSPPAWATLLVIAFGWGPVMGAEIYVNNKIGKDQWTGQAKSPNENDGPLQTIARAVGLANPGDTIHLEPTDSPYQEEIIFRNKGGAPAQPISLDGHGAIIDGSEACPTKDWQKAGDQLWYLADTHSRNALIVEDRIVLERKLAADLLPGTFCFENTQFEKNVLFFRPPENRKAKDCTIEVVMANGQTLTLDPSKWKGGPIFRYKLESEPERVLIDGTKAPFSQPKDHLKAGEWCMSGPDLYYFPPAGKVPSDIAIRRIVRGTGVSVSGTSRHLVIRNLNVRFVWNDAYNIHGRVADTTFQNCHARDCYDEGFSAHDRCETVLDGAVFERCDNGVFNVNEDGWSVTRNLTVRECRDYGFGVAVTDTKARHWLTDALLENNPIPLFGRNLETVNIRIANKGPARLTFAGPIVIDRATVEADHLAIEIMRGNGSADLKRSVFLSANALDVTFLAPSPVTMDSVYWSPQTVVIPKPGAEKVLLTAWLETLGSKAHSSGPLDKGKSIPAGVGFQE